MAVPTSRTTFKEYCLRKLGKPVIEINVISATLLTILFVIVIYFIIKVLLIGKVTYFRSILLITLIVYLCIDAQSKAPQKA